MTLKDMNSALFQYALLPLPHATETADWIVIDHDKKYQNVDVLDFPQELTNQVFDLFEKTYRRYIKKNTKLLISHSDGLLKYNRWILFYRKDDPEKKIVSFFLFRTTDFGLKSGLTGSDGTKEGKKSVISFKIKSFNTFGGFGEISGRLEKLIINDVPVVEFEVAKNILKQLGKTDVVKTTNNHYSREIGNLGIVEKIMVGLPEEKT